MGARAEEAERKKREAEEAEQSGAERGTCGLRLAIVEGLSNTG